MLEKLVYLTTYLIKLKTKFQEDGGVMSKQMQNEDVDQIVWQKTRETCANLDSTQHINQKSWCGRVAACHIDVTFFQRLGQNHSWATVIICTQKIYFFKSLMKSENLSPEKLEQTADLQR